MQKPSSNSYSSEAIHNIGIDFISIECLEKLGLNQNPFIDHARDPFLFTDKQLEMSINVIMDFLLNQNSTIVLLGETGVGKTTHLRILLRKGYQKFNFCTLRAKPKITFTEIEQKITERWCLPKDNHEIDSHENLTTSELIKKYIEDNKQPILIIDDAHRLQISVLDELLKLKHHVGLQSPHTMGLVLASEPTLQTQLAELEQINPAATQIYQINIRSFDANQCKEYIQYRMDKAGSSNEALLSSEKIKEIYAKSNGLPKHINRLAREEIFKLCDENTLEISAANKFKLNPSMRLAVILAGLIALLVVLLVLTNSSDSPKKHASLDLSKPKVEQEKIPGKSASVTNTKASSTSNGGEIAAKDKSAPLTLKSEKKPIAKPYVAPLVLGPVLNSNTKVATNKQELKSTDKTKSLVETKISSYSSDWILKQDPNAYTIQIVAAENEENLVDFAKKNFHATDTAYYQKTTESKTWYVLVHGTYSTREDALRSIENLSNSLKKNTPYPVQIKHLQEVIRQQ